MNTPCTIGGLIFPGIDQADFTGPYEVLASMPGAKFLVLAKELGPVRDAHGLVLTPDMTLHHAPPLDVLLIPGGGGVNALMEDENVLAFVRRQAAGARIVFSVCTGALVLGAAGLLRGRRATTHWASHPFLSLFGATPVPERVVVDGNLVTAAGVTAGIDGALRVVAMLHDVAAAQTIQLYIQYAPEPPFGSGTPETAPPDLVAGVRAKLGGLLDARRAIIERITAKATSL